MIYQQLELVLWSRWNDTLYKAKVLLQLLLYLQVLLLICSFFTFGLSTKFLQCSTLSIPSSSQFPLPETSHSILNLCYQDLIHFLLTSSQFLLPETTQFTLNLCHKFKILHIFFLHPLIVRCQKQHDSLNLCHLDLIHFLLTFSQFSMLNPGCWPLPSTPPPTFGHFTNCKSYPCMHDQWSCHALGIRVVLQSGYIFKNYIAALF